MSVPTRRERLSGWGRFPVAECNVAVAGRTDIAHAIAGGAQSLIARGLGRSYGDASLNPALTVVLTPMNRLIALDETGMLECEAGVSLEDLIVTLLPRGWFVPVTPGTRHVTVGGMIAADVHGKNHHRHGSFCDHVAWLDLALPDGRVVRCSASEHQALFSATCGGMGLTGIILRAAIKMLRVGTSRIRQRTIVAPNLDNAIAQLEAAMDWTYSVAWIDCLATGAALGRSIIFLGEHAQVEELPPAQRSDPFFLPTRRRKGVPFDFPSFALSSLSVRAFNMLYHARHRNGEALVDLEPYFYPLDAIANWNRIYGRRGFVQYQCVLPLETSPAGLTRLLEAISEAGEGSFLAVLKRMGERSHGLMSFPMPGYTLALDFPVKAPTLELLNRLDDITLAFGGRLYLAKDSRSSARMIAAGYPELDSFREVRRDWGVDGVFASLQSRRLEL